MQLKQFWFFRSQIQFKEYTAILRFINNNSLIEFEIGF